MPRTTIVKTEFEAGYIVTTDESGNRRRYPISAVLRSADIPDLGIASLTLLTTLAQVVMVLVKTMVEQGQIGEELVSGFDLQYLLDTLIDDLSAENV